MHLITREGGSNRQPSRHKSLASSCHLPKTVGDRLGGLKGPTPAALSHVQDFLLPSVPFT